MTNQSLNPPSSAPCSFTVNDTIRQLLTALEIKVDPQQYSSADEFVRALPEGKLKRILYHRRSEAKEGKPLWFFAKRTGLPVETITKDVNDLAKSLSAPVINCDQCKTQINAIHFVCLACKNYVLCESCEVNNQHQATTNENHIFAKVGAPYALKLRKIVKERKQAWRAEHGCRNESESPCGRMRKKWLKRQYGHCHRKSLQDDHPSSDSEQNSCHASPYTQPQPHPHAGPHSFPQFGFPGFHGAHSFQGHAFHQPGFQHPHPHPHHPYSYPHPHPRPHPHPHPHSHPYPYQPNHPHHPHHPRRGFGCRQNGPFARPVANPMHYGPVNTHSCPFDKHHCDPKVDVVSYEESPCVSFGETQFHSSEFLVEPEMTEIPENCRRHRGYHPYHMSRGSRCGKHGRGRRMRHEKYHKHSDSEDSSDEESFQMMFIQQQLAEIQNTLSEM